MKISRHANSKKQHLKRIIFCSGISDTQSFGEKDFRIICFLSLVKLILISISRNRKLLPRPGRVKSASDENGNLKLKTIKDGWLRADLGGGGWESLTAQFH